MDEINDFFDFSKDFERKTVPRGCVSGSVASTAGQSQNSKLSTRECVGTEYVKDLIKRENLLLKQDDLEGVSDDTEDDEPKVNRIDDGIYDRYNFDIQFDKTLPIHESKEEIVATIRGNSVVIIEGDTGCGKTTQVPQYILEDAYRRREYCKIVCTQPRRIAAISLARRVASECKWEEGTIVGYQVGLHANLSPDMRLLYCTTGVLLQKLIREKSLTHYTHIILDEVHERDQDMDFLLVIVRRLLATNSKYVKIVLMSATINTGEFANYFKIRKNPALVVRVDSRRLYQVREFYLGDLGRINNNNNVKIVYNKPGISKEMYGLVLKLIIVIDNIEKQEVLTNARNSGDAGGSEAAVNENSILLFLPGINEIDQMCKKFDRLNEIDEEGNIRLYPLRLHSLTSSEEQMKVFHRAPMGYRKVILATNIAESSITVPDVKYVIDFCLMKSLITDTTTDFSCLQLHWASRANCRQRAGRAGRVMNGRVYRMVPKDFYENYMAEYDTPEMLRCPLVKVVLKAKLLDMGPPRDILGLAMNPPNLSDIQNTILTLKEMGALYTHVSGIYSVEDGDISFLGRVMAALPLDVRLSRLIILGYMFSCLEDALIMAAGLSVRSIYKIQNKNAQCEMDAYIQKLVWADGSGSDLFALLKAYKVWTSMREHNHMKNEESENWWAKRCSINLRSIREMHLLIVELKDRLEFLGLKEQTGNQRVHWTDNENAIILKVIIAGAFYPNYFIRSNLNEIERERTIYQTLCGNDPCSTVYFTNLNSSHIGQLYIRSIKELFRNVCIQPANIDVRFQTGSERIFVSFKSDPEDELDGGHSGHLVVAGSVRPEVYKALRMRMSGMKTIINVMDPRVGTKYAEKCGIGVMSENGWLSIQQRCKNIELMVLPSVWQRSIRGYITHIENCSKFYFQPIGELERLREIHDLLNDSHELEKCRFKSPAAIAKGMLLSAPFEQRYRRARVIKAIPASRDLVQFRVFFVDYGNVASIDFQDLRWFSKSCSWAVDMPPRMFECRLALVKPSPVKSPNGKWTEEAKDLLQEYADAGIVEIDVYSLVGKVANVVIKTKSSTFNDVLVEKHLASKSEENYLSKTDHDLRMRKQSSMNRFLSENNDQQKEEYFRSIQTEVDLDVAPPPHNLCLQTVKLHGPFSPLETRVFCAMRAGAWNCVQIERESVNSILLDTDPQDMHERLLVAADINQTQSGDTLIARCTTLMPNIHGFAALMTLLFCPTMQMKCNKNHTKYVAVLAGLGYDPHTHKPLYAEHDIVLNLDVEISNRDLDLINQMRYCMDAILYTEPGDERPSILPMEVADLTVNIKKIIMSLLSRNRKYIETHFDGSDNVWECYDPNEIIESVAVFGERCIFPMHSAVRLYDESDEEMHDLSVHCKQLYQLRKFDCSIQPITCRLCNQLLENVAQLRLHLLSQLHRDREHQIHFKSSF